MATLLIAIIIAYAIIVEWLDWPSRLKALKAHHLWAWNLVNNRPGRIGLILIAIGLLSAQLRQNTHEAQHTHVEMFPPEMLAVEPALPFLPNKVMKLEMIYKNGTPAVGPVRNASMQAKIYYEPTDSEITGDDMYSDFLRTTKFEPVESMLFEQDKIEHHTYYGTALTTGQAELLTGGKLALCMAGGVKWEDDSGTYRTELCSCMNPLRHEGAIPPWGNCSKHNGEVRIRWFDRFVPFGIGD